MTVFSLENYFSLIFFINSYLIIDIYEVKLDKLPNLF